MSGRADGREGYTSATRSCDPAKFRSFRKGTYGSLEELVIVLAGLGDDRRTLSVRLLHTRREKGGRGEGGKGSHCG